MNRILYSKYSNERAARFQIRTDIIEDENKKRYAVKTACTKEAQAHIDLIEKNSKLLDKSYERTILQTNHCRKAGNALVFDYIEEDTLEQHLDKLLKEKDYTALVNEIRKFFDLLKSTMELSMFTPTQEFVNVFGNIDFPEKLQASSLNNIDYIFGNIFTGKDKWTVIDYEWTFDFPIPFLYIVYRAIHYYTYDSSRKALKDLGLLRIMGVSEELEKCFEVMENHFQLYILGEITPVINMYGDIAGPAFELEKMLEVTRRQYKNNCVQVYYNYGNGFSEETSKWIAPSDYDIDKNRYNYEIEINGAVELRVDPGNRSCIIRDMKAVCTGGEFTVPKVVHNAHVVPSGVLVFSCTDPMFVFSSLGTGSTTLSLSIMREVITVDAAMQIAGLIDDYNHSIPANEKLKEEIAEITGKVDEKEEQKKVLENRLAAAQNQSNVLRQQIAALSEQVAVANNRYQDILNSTSIRFTKPLRYLMRGIKKVLKSNKFTYKFCRGLKCLKENGFVYTYKHTKEKIAKKMEPKAGKWAIDPRELERQRQVVFGKNIKFSIIVPLYNTPLNYLQEMIESVQEQTYANWELCLADGSDAQHMDVEKTVRRYMKKDSRIKYRKLANNEGISENTNRCLEMAEGDYIALFDHDDLLHPTALFENMCVIERQDADFIYSDEDTFSQTPADAYCPHYKPDFSPDTLRSYNYICHFSVFKKSLLDSVGWFRKEFDGSQDYDMILRLTEKAEKIVHIPKIIYYWRAHPASVASNISAKTYCLDAAKKALDEHLQRVGLKGRAVDASIPSVYKMQYDIIGNPLISIIIPNKDYIEDLSKCINSILDKSTYRNFEIIVVENNSELEETFEYYKEIEKNPQVKVVYWESEFNYSAINNFGFKYTKGEYILLLNNDMEVITADWLQEMLMFAQRRDVGAVGAKLYYPDNTVQHAGIIIGIGGVAGHSHKNFPRDAYGYSSRLQLAQNLSAVTAACLMMSRDVFEEVGGLDEGFKVAFNDVDLCMKIRKAGYLIVFTPFAELYHYESKSRGYENTPEKVARFNSEINRFYSKWDPQLEAGDPYYNPNLTLRTEDFAVKPPDEGRIRA